MKALLTGEEVAVILGVTPGTLRTWRYLAQGPKYVKLSNRWVRYKPEDVQEYIDSLPYAA